MPRVLFGFLLVLHAGCTSGKGAPSAGGGGGLDVDEGGASSGTAEDGGDDAGDDDSGGSGGSSGGGGGSGGSGSGSGSGGSGGGSGSGGDGYGCGDYVGSHFYIANYTLIVDPIDFYGESWDWDGGGIGDFHEQYGDYIDYLLFVLSKGTVEPGTTDLAWELADLFAPLIMSPYVSPDLSTDIYWWDGGELEYLSSGDNYDDTTIMSFYSFEMRTPEPYEGYLFDLYDRDVAFDDYAGWMWLDGYMLREVVDCGPMVWLLGDDEMAEYGTRVRVVYLDVESW